MPRSPTRKAWNKLETAHWKKLTEEVKIELPE